MKLYFLVLLIISVDLAKGQSNLFFNPAEGSTLDQVSTGGSAHMSVRPLPFDPGEPVIFDKRMTFSAHTIAGRSSTSEFLVNSEKGYMGMNKEMMERFSGTELPDNENMKIHYRLTATNGKTYYYIEVNGIKQVVNRLPIDNIEADQTNMSVKKFNENFAPSGNTLNVSSQNYQSKEYTGTSSETGRPVNVYVADQNNVTLNPSNTPKTVGMFGLGYIYNDNKTQLVTRVENDNGTAELERIENINLSFRGSHYRKREEVVAEDHNRVSNVKEDVLQKNQEAINRNPDRTMRNKDQEIQDKEMEMESKRKRAMNKYIEDGAPGEENAKYALESFDPKDFTTIRKLECEKRIIEIEKKMSRMSASNAGYARLANEKTCQEEKIIAYKNAENEMIAMQERHGDNTHEANKEKMDYFFNHVTTNIMARPCSGGF